MQEIKRKYIDWRKTGKRLLNLRTGNTNLRRYVCWYLKYDKGNCSGDCGNCEYEMDASISRSELAAVFTTTESVIFNWENGKTSPELEDLLLYAEICGIPLEQIVVYG